MIAAFGGALEAHLNFFVDPTSYGFNGAVDPHLRRPRRQRDVLGPVVGALVLTALPVVFRRRDYSNVVAGLFLIAVIVFRPQGIVGRPRGRVGSGRSSRSWRGVRAPARPRPRRAMIEASPCSSWITSSATSAACGPSTECRWRCGRASIPG